MKVPMSSFVDGHYLRKSRRYHDSFGRTLVSVRRLTETLIEKLRLDPGHPLLDLACGLDLIRVTKDPDISAGPDAGRKRVQ